MTIAQYFYDFRNPIFLVILSIMDNTVGKKRKLLSLYC